MQKEGQNKLFKEVKDYIPKSVITRKNKAKTWLYGYDDKYDFIVISKSGKIGSVIEISGLKIGLPLPPKSILKRSKSISEQYWERKELPKELSKIQSIFQWNEMPINFKNKWVDYIENEFDRREEGLWFLNNGIPTYITGAHYTYLQ